MAHCEAGALQPALDTDVQDKGSKREDDKDIGANDKAEVDDATCGFHAVLQDGVHVR